MNFTILENNFLENSNQAIIFNKGATNVPMDSNDPQPQPIGKRIDASNVQFQVLSFDTNHVRLAIEVPYTKFLIYEI